MATRIQFRRGTEADWTSANPVLAEGELGLELDTGKFKIGIGTTSWTNLEYAFENIDELNVTGIGTVGSLSIGSTQVISSARQLQNIVSLDATTTATIESAVAAAPNDFTSLNISGISTFSGITTHTTSLFGTQASFSGVITATSFVGAITGTVTGTATSTTNIPNLIGDITSVNTATTLATVNSNVGSFGSQTLIPVVTVNAKGLVTAVTTAAVGSGLTVTGDSGSENIDLLTETLTISGGTNLTSSAASNSVTVNLDPNISLTSVNASGVITATSGFSGNVTGNVTGNLTGNINSSGVSTVTSLNATNVNVSGISTLGVTSTTNLTSQQLNVSGITTLGVTSVSSLIGYSALVGTASSTTTTFVVTVASKTSNHRYFGSGSANAYFIDGIESPFLTLLPGKTYLFNQDDGSNGGHQLLFYYQADKTTLYSTNVSIDGTPGSPGAYTVIVVTDTTPVVLHYQCSDNDYMGNAAHFSSNVVDTPYEITARSGISVTGVVTATTFVGALTGTATSTTNIPNLTGAITSVNTTTSLGSFSSSDLSTALTDETGTGSAVFATSPTLVTPVLGAATGTSLSLGNITLESNGNATILGQLELGNASDTTITRVSAGVVAIEGVNVVTVSATQTLTNKTLTSPILTTPSLGIATATSIVVGSGVTINASGIVASAGIITASSFVGSLTGTASTTTNIPNLTGAITSVNTTTSLGSFSSSDLSTALTDETGSGSAVFATSPTLVTPVLGAASATSIVVSSGSTFTNGPILVGSATSTGTASQPLQVTGGAYVSGNLGIGVTAPSFKADIAGDARVTSTNKMRFGGTTGSTNFYIQYNSTTNSLDFVAG